MEFAILCFGLFVVIVNELKKLLRVHKITTNSFENSYQSLLKKKTFNRIHITINVFICFQCENAENS